MSEQQMDAGCVSSDAERMKAKNHNTVHLIETLTLLRRSQWHYIHCSGALQHIVVMNSRVDFLKGRKPGSTPRQGR